MPKLSTNMVVMFERRPHQVAMVNDCRAVIVPIKRLTSLATQPSVLNPYPDGQSISPNSELEILSRHTLSITSRPLAEPVSTDHQPELF